ncbi:tetratricopeptide repeat protein [Wocania ichthyoenteri]|uniref:tetratricopeptide repeat protein n=1 Tax=Wocania ichthyoenteri TaxID=1230531 RepID=UPI00053E4CA3|nr:tetratricopeptide repeat protein [Wocania ichthyoenteri]
MKNILIIILTLFTAFSFAQEKEQLLALKKANNYVYEGNSLVNEDDFVSAEMAYRKAISEQPTSIAGIYNLGNSYYKKGNYEEALYRHQQAAKNAVLKTQKHKAFHNIGNILMQNKKCKEAVEAYKNALRNNPTDDETRYNLGLAKACAEQQKDQEDQNKDDENKDNKDDQENKENEDKKDKEGEDKEDKKDEGDKDKKEGDDKKDEEGKPKDEKEDKGKGEDDKKKDQQKPKPQPGQLSPQQIKSLLEAMNNQEKKVQEKINAEKQKGVKIKTEKDW